MIRRLLMKVKRSDHTHLKKANTMTEKQLHKTAAIYDKLGMAYRQISQKPEP